MLYLEKIIDKLSFIKQRIKNANINDEKNKFVSKSGSQQIIKPTYNFNIQIINNAAAKRKRLSTKSNKERLVNLDQIGKK